MMVIRWLPHANSNPSPNPNANPNSKRCLSPHVYDPAGAMGVHIRGLAVCIRPWCQTYPSMGQRHLSE